MAHARIDRLMSGAFLVIAVAATAFVGNAAYREMERGKRIQEEIAALEEEARRTRQENNVLQEKIRYFQTDAFQSQEARSKLNYQAPDEQVVVVESSVGAAEDLPNQENSLAQNRRLVPNYRKWLEIFHL